MELFRTIISRPNPWQLPDLALPLHVRSTGHYRVGADWTERRPSQEKPFVQFFWGLAGSGEIEVEGRPHRLEAGKALYLLPGEDHVLNARETVWEYRWLVFDGPLAGEFMRGYGYPRGAFPAGKCPEELFARIEQGLREMSPFSQRHLVAVAAEILACAGRRRDETTPAGRLVGRFIELAQTHYADPAVNLNTLTRILGVHRSTLTRLFVAEMKLPPGQYLLRLRLQRGLSLLRETDRPIAEIARLAGIPEPGYFCRAVRRLVGVGPREFRRSARNLSL